MYLAGMYLVFDPNTFINNLKALGIGLLILAVLFKIAGAVGLNRVQSALVAVVIAVIGFMAVQGTLIQDLASWAQKQGGG